MRKDLGLDVQGITDFATSSESQAPKLKKSSPAASRGGGIPRRESRKTRGHFSVYRPMFPCLTIGGTTSPKE
jgi:hypothetical protein